MIAFVNHWELLVILAVVLLLFGHRLPGMARSLGSGITEFKRGLKDGAGNAKVDAPKEGGAGESAASNSEGSSGVSKEGSPR